MALWILSLALFAVGTTSLVVLGVGPEITREFRVSSGDAGWLMTLFAGTFAIAAPTVQYLVPARLSRRALVVAGLLLLALGLLWASMAETFVSLMISRCCAALGGALIAPTSAALALSLVPRDRQGRALATVFAGFTLATVVGVPLATWLTLAVGWRGAMAAIGGFACITALAVAALVREPARDTLSPPNNRSLRAFVGPPTAALLTTIGVLAAQFVIYALMAEVLVGHFGLASEALPIAMLVFGVSGVAGNAFAGVLSDRLGSGFVVWLSLGCLLMMFGAFLLDFSPITAVLIFAGCAFGGTLFTAPQQARLSGLVSRESQALLLGLNASASYVGISLGSALASILYATEGFDLLPAAALALLLLAALANAFGRARPEAVD